MEDADKSYHECVAELEKLVAEIENPSRPLETVAADVKKAVALIELCRRKLRENKEQLDKILE